MIHKELVPVTSFSPHHLIVRSKKIFIMHVEKIVSTLRRKNYLIISEAELNELLSKSDIILEEETHISDKIRLLKYKEELLIQEKSTKEEFLIRGVKTKKDAEDFIKERLEIYNRMWDGCGCKIDYYK